VYSIDSTNNSRRIGARNSFRELRLMAIAITATFLLAFGTHAASSGPASGGNTLTITGTGLGNGSDITNVTLCVVVAAIQSQTANSVTVVAGAGYGTGNILVYSSSVGVTTFANGYTYNPPGAIFGPLSWSTSSGPNGLYSLAAVSANGKIYALGGNDGNGNPQSTVYVYDPSQPSLHWLTVSNLPAPSSGLAAVNVNDKIYAIGVGTNRVCVYDPAQPTLGWLSLSNLPATPSYLAAAAVNGQIYAVGVGTSGVYVYDPSQPTLGWLSVSNLPVSSSGMAAASANGKIYAFGGSNGVAYAYDPSQPAQGWLSVSNLPAADWGLAAASVNGKIYAITGQSGGVGQSWVYVYDPAQPTLGWLRVNDPGLAFWFAAATSMNGNLYLMGGYNNGAIYYPLSQGSFAPPVVPSSGPVIGGNTVTITGVNLGNHDVTNVTLCGVPATIVTDHSPTQVVVTAGSALFAGNGDVVVSSTSYGVSVATNAYTYFVPVPGVLAPTNITLNGFCANWSAVSGATNYLLDVSTTSNFTSSVPGYTNVSAGNATTFCVSGLDPLTTYYYRVRCQQNGVTSGNSAPVVQTLMMNNGPASGGNTLTITKAGLGNGSDITSVIICGVAATIQSQTANSVTVVLGAGGTGTGNIVVYSVNAGVTTFVNSYTYNPPGAMFGPLMGWSDISNKTFRATFAATSLNGKIYIIGGTVGGGSGSPSYLNSVMVYDTAQPALGWSSVSSLPMAYGYMAAASANGKIYVMGGGSIYSPTRIFSNVYVYDPSQPGQGWLSVGNLPVAGQGFPAVTADGKIYAIEGQSAVYVYDPAQPTLGWSSVSNLPAGSYPTQAMNVNGKIYALGSGFCVYDPSQPTQGWLSLSNLPSVGAAASLNGKIYAVGGNGINVYVYDPAQPTLGWLSASSLPASHTYAVVNANGNIYALGGDNGNAPTNSPVFVSSFASGVVPSSGPLGGGNTVTISGNYLDNGDVTNVTLCGIPATILADNSPTQLVVTAGAAVIPTNGNVVVKSASYGVTVASSVYRYLSYPTIITSNSLPPGMAGFSYNQTLTASGGAAPYTWSVISGSLPPGLNLSTNGVISGIPTAATKANFTVRVLGNDGLSSSNPFSLLIGGETARSGPESGGNTLTITGMGLGNGSDITNVTICGIAAVIVSQTANSVTVVLGVGESGIGNILIYSASAGVTTFRNVYAYNPSGAIFGAFTGWTSLSNLPAASEYMAATSVNGKIYAIGGNSSGIFQSNVYVYDTAQPTKGWLSISNLPVASFSLGAASVSGKIYAVGGFGNSGSEATVYMYDPAQPTLGWLSVSNLPAQSSGLVAATVNGKIYAMVGNSGSTYVYDPAQPTLGWLSLSNLPATNSGVAAASANGKIYVIGGPSGNAYVYDPSQPALGWSSVSNLPVSVEYLAATSVNGKIYAIGGSSPSFDIQSPVRSTVYVYDPAQPSLGWLSVSNLPQPLGTPAGVSANGHIYSIGGYNYLTVYSSVYENTYASGVVPSSGPLAGGYTVTISGDNLGNHDVTNVTLCGVPATILADYSPTQLVVTAGAAAIPTHGDVVVQSASYGVTVSRSAYTYISPPTITVSNSLPPGMVGTAYNQGLTASGGVTPYHWTITSGSLPPGLNLNLIGNGVISGIPTVATNASFTVQVTGADGQFVTNALSLTVIMVTITESFDGTNLLLSWPTNCLGWTLEAQTNGLGTNWFPVTGSAASNQFLILINPTNGSVFYRLHQ
jgi:N-acetylneuraminic acid mutarotase